jgi:hypothetical protein
MRHLRPAQRRRLGVAAQGPASMSSLCTQGRWRPISSTDHRPLGSRSRRRLRLPVILATMSVLGLSVTTAPSAGADTPGQVSNVTAVISGPSNAAGALTEYTVSFTTSSTSGLVGDGNSNVAVTFPAGTG